MKVKKQEAYKELGISLLLCVLFLAAASAIGLLFKAWGFKESNIVVVYLLAVILSARYGKGYLPGILSTVAAILLFNYFFTAPYYTLHVNEAGYFVTFLIMTCVSLITSALTAKMKESARLAHKKAEENQILLQLMEELNQAREMEQVARLSINAFSRYLHVDAGCVYLNEEEELEHTYVQKVGEEFERRKVKEYDALLQLLEHYDKPYLVSVEFNDFLIRGQEGLLGLMRIPLKDTFIMDEDVQRFLRSMINCVALAMERIQADIRHLKFKEEANAQRYRANMLRAISHDLRTPLTGIMGTSEMLKSALQQQKREYELADGIYKDAQWLYGLVENILSLTRLQEGQMQLHLQSEAIDELIGVALSLFEKRSERRVHVELPQDIVMVEADGQLLEQVLLNLLDNADKHTPKEGKVAVLVTSSEDSVTLSVEDEGEGISKRDLPNIFEMFYTTSHKHADAAAGIGLGLSICKTIIEAHGGAIRAENRTDGSGARFIFTLPRKGSVL